MRKIADIPPCGAFGVHPGNLAAGLAAGFESRVGDDALDERLAPALVEIFASPARTPCAPDSVIIVQWRLVCEGGEKRMRAEGFM